MKKTGEIKQMFKKAFIGISLLLLVSCLGCATRMTYKDNLFEYQPALSKQKIDKVVGLNLLLDKRPEVEKKNLPPDKYIYDSVSERVTLLLVDDFKKSNLFREIHSPAQPTDDIIIDGTIDRLFWEPCKKTAYGQVSENPISGLFPLVGIVGVLGASHRQEYTIITLSLTVKDNKNDKVLANLQKTAKAAKGISFYTKELGQDVALSFRTVTQKLKEDLAKIDFNQ